MFQYYFSLRFAISALFIGAVSIISILFRPILLISSLLFLIIPHYIMFHYWRQYCSAHCFSTISANPPRFVTILILFWQILFIARHYLGTSFTISHYFALFRQMLLIARQYFGTISANPLHCSSLFWHYFSLFLTIFHYFGKSCEMVENSKK